MKKILSFLTCMVFSLFTVMSMVNVYAAAPLTGDNRVPKIVAGVVCGLCALLIIAMIILNNHNKKRKQKIKNSDIKDSSSDNAEDIDID